MVQINPDEESLKEEYDNKYPKYEKLAKSLENTLKRLLEGTNYIIITSRIKEYDSLLEKIQRKNYDKPFEKMKDICGLRIVCPYLSDTEIISKIINDEFDVEESVDKSDLLEPDKFGYRSYHFIIKLKKDWLTVPDYRDLGGIKAEIQLRTILMHAWADIEHVLSYKSKEDVPRELQRDLSKLSALLELADGQLDDLWNRKIDYMEGILQDAKARGDFDTSKPINFDSFEAFIQYHFPDIPSQWAQIDNILYLLREYDVKFVELSKGYEKTKEILNILEKEISERSGTYWRPGQVDVIYVILDLTNDKFWKDRLEKGNLNPYYLKSMKKWRKEIKMI